MSQFDDIRSKLASARSETQKQRGELLRAREAVRRALPGRALDAARARADAAAARLAELSSAERAVLDQFSGISDPRKGMSSIQDSAPVLLFPLRLETRFKPDDAGSPQLLLRVYPDPCLVDTFEESLTDQELANARRFWSFIWRAGGDETLERSAWRDLVASHGSGRSGWIVRTYAPLNPGDKPVRGSAADLILVILSSGPLQPAAGVYWSAIWKGTNDNGVVDPGVAQSAYDALKSAVGAAQAADISQNFRPFNISDPPPSGSTRAGANVVVSVLQLTPAADVTTRQSSWSSAPRVDLLPDRFVFIGYGDTGDPLVQVGSPVITPLVAGPDPNAPPDQQLKALDDTLQIPDDMAWMYDFDRAVAVGMGMRINLSPSSARAGFRRVIVLGVRLSDSSSEGAQNLGLLLEHHLRSRKGLEIIPQGTPTNNTEKGGSGYTSRDDADATFGIFFKGDSQYTPAPDPLVRQDGEWLTRLLGLDEGLVQQIPGSGLTDQSDARAMQIALWSGTLGYMMRTLLAPVFSESVIESARTFFTRSVSGRGPLPAIRIGDQPYGILPVAPFDRIGWFTPEEQNGFPGALHGTLLRIRNDWNALVPSLSYLGKPGGDPDQTLLDVLALHPASVEYYPLQSESMQHKFYETSLVDPGFSVDFLKLFPAALPLGLLRSFGYTGSAVPDMLNQVFKLRETPLSGPIVDDRPLSEATGIRNYAGTMNYIAWLVDAAQNGVERIQQEEGFDGDVRPAALLYLMLRNALQMSFAVTGTRLSLNAGLIPDSGNLYREPAFVHVSGASTVSESRYSLLFGPAAAITGRPDLLLGDYIAQNVQTVDPHLAEQIAALARLAPLSTARLERLFAEHVDTACYRLDAWMTGMATSRLESLQSGPEGKGGGGLYIGAYGWLEPLRPKSGAFTPAVLPDDVTSAVNSRGGAPLMQDSTNEGLVHAPSINHAATAAVLRAGYLANDGRLAVNITSRRVRRALDVMEGMRNGQSIGALLGYQFERFIFDNGPLQVFDVIYPLRLAFPLVANQIADTATTGGDPAESVAAMNVVDGRKLIEYVETQGNFVYPFGRTDLPHRAPDQESAVTNALAYIRDMNDGLADLALAESVHQAVIGNYDRSAGTLDAFAKGSPPPEPDVIRTPRSGIALTLRSAIHFSPDPPANPLPAIPLTPLAAAEPALNAWLKGRLPSPDNVGCSVTYTDRGTGLETSRFITQAHVGLHPIDVVYRVDVNASQAVTDIDDSILRYIHTNFSPRFDREIRIRYTDRSPGNVTWFELQPLVTSLRTLTVASRPLNAGDVMRHNDAPADTGAGVTLPKSRVQIPRDALVNTHLPALASLASALAGNALAIDDVLAQYSSIVGALSSYRLPQTGIGLLYEWRSGAYSALTEKIAARVAVWDERLSRFGAILNDYDNNLPPGTTEDEKLARLRAADVTIGSHMVAPPPADSHAYRLALTTKRGWFKSKRDALQQLVDVPRSALSTLLADAVGQLPVDAYDPAPMDFADTQSEIARFRQSLASTAALIRADVATRIQSVDDLLSGYAAADPPGQVKILQQCAALLFGADFNFVPLVTLPAAASADFQNAVQYSTSGGLTAYLTDPAGAGRDFPVDDWLHGVARVRENMHHWENALILGEAFGADTPGDLTPVQVPSTPGDPWLALEYPASYTIPADRLLYAAHFAEPYDPSKPLCGLLLDEWTEVIPAREETTGIAFNFDRPNSEPPQSWLVAVPSGRSGAWSWDDLLAAVNDTLDAAKLRALEPAHLGSTPYNWFLPATMSPYTYPEISISNNLLRNVSIYSGVKVE